MKCVLAAVIGVLERVDLGLQDEGEAERDVERERGNETALDLVVAEIAGSGRECHIGDQRESRIAAVIAKEIDLQPGDDVAEAGGPGHVAGAAGSRGGPDVGRQRQLDFDVVEEAEPEGRVGQGIGPRGDVTEAVAVIGVDKAVGLILEMAGVHGVGRGRLCRPIGVEIAHRAGRRGVEQRIAALVGFRGVVGQGRRRQ